MRLSVFLIAAGLVSGAAIPVRNAEREMAFVRRAGLERERGVQARAAVQSTRATLEQDIVAAIHPRAPEPAAIKPNEALNPRSHSWDAVERGAVDIWVE
ncbi:hypothetical protein A1Q2_01836 [Trichosporon asahii var. asahii CBS 8904]|uniref:Uncharacterized protein n=1 Tax=Trichosporon asahii var. asahii (strain CBS 8904) TaxID=1220162 RepID=K1W4M6_TRIAC|nr:hypothetical protein A1Q2_01836 [Trichosporon asahii var. asahii CBS 8904]